MIGTADHRFTLLDFMNLKRFPHQMLLTPQIDPAYIRINHISVIEAPVEKFVRRDELVLTTVLGCRDDEKTFLRFIKDICKSGAAAIAVSFPEDLDELVPQSVRRYAVSQGVPVVRLPWRYRFAEITETVLEQLHTVEKRREEDWESFEKRMLEAYLNRQDIQEAAKIIEHQIRAGVLITDLGGRPVACTGRPDLMTDGIVPGGIMAKYHLLARINSQGQDIGCLYAEAARTTPKMLDSVIPFVSYILTPLQLWFDREDIVRAGRLRETNDLIQSLMTGKITATEAVLARGRALGLHLTHSYYCAAANLTLKGRGQLCEWLDDHEQELNRRLTSDHTVPILTIYLEHIVVYSERIVPPEDLIAHLQQIIGAAYPELNCVWGVSDSSGSREFDRLYREALLAADLCRRENTGACVCYQKDILLYYLLKGCLADPDSCELRDRSVGALLKYDGENGTHLADLLLCYLQCGGNVCRTAEALHYHRQSLRYRLHRVEELLGISLDNHDQLLAVELSLRLKKYAGPQAKAADVR